MRRSYIYIIMCVVLSCILHACGNGHEGDEDGRTYLVRGAISVDSTLVLDNHLVLFTDNHRTMRTDTIRVEKDGTFLFEGHGTSGVDELYLCNEDGELCRFYASGDMEVNLSLTNKEPGVLTVEYAQNSDSINGWLQEKKDFLSGKDRLYSRALLDSLLRNYPTDIRVALLLREQMPVINDSLYVRQSLGSLKDVAKPDWMKKSIDQMLHAMGSGKTTYSRRLQTSAFELPDTIIDLSTSRSDYLLVYFWADYSKTSIDTLRALSRLIDLEYDHKRVSFLSCCLYAQDSAMWKLYSGYMPGNHTWVKGGFSDPRMRAWNIQVVPSIILMDMYCNQQQRDVWGAELRKALDRIPNRIGYQKKN